MILKQLRNFMFLILIGTCVVSTQKIYGKNNTIVGYIRTDRNCITTIYDKNWLVKSRIRKDSSGNYSIYDKNWKREGKIK